MSTKIEVKKLVELIDKAAETSPADVKAVLTEFARSFDDFPAGAKVHLTEVFKVLVEDSLESSKE